MFLCFQATFLPSLYEENFLWKNLLIAVVAVCILFKNMFTEYTAAVCVCVCVCVRL